MCSDAQDLNDDGALSLADPLFNLNFQFQMGPQPVDPFPDCGFDPTSDTAGFGDLGCATAGAGCL